MDPSTLPTAETHTQRVRPFQRMLAALAALVVAVTLLPATPAEAYYNEGSQLPGTYGRANQGGSKAGGERRCGTAADPYKKGGTLWRLDKGTWRVEIPSYPLCTGKISVVVNPSTNEVATFRAETPGEDWSNWGSHLSCDKYYEVLRFYGPRNNPAQYVTRSIINPVTNCLGITELGSVGEKLGVLAKFGVMVPHPHDAHRQAKGSQFQSTPTYRTTGPLSEAWQPMGNFSTGTHCPKPDDTANLRRFFSTTWPTEEEAQMARYFRQGIGATYATLLSRVRAARLPDSVALVVLNASGTRRYAGDSFTSLAYSDGIPCSSPLDFTVPYGQTPWVYGVCLAPVTTSYRGPVYSRQNGRVYYGVVESYPDVVDHEAYQEHTGRKDARLPDYNVEGALRAFAQTDVTPAKSTDPIVRAYRTRAAGILGKTDQFIYAVPGNGNKIYRSEEMAANLPCAYGQGPVEPREVIIETREPVDPIPVTGQGNVLAYVGGARTAQTIPFRPGAVTCRGGRSCTQGQVIRSITYSPTISVPAGWTACGTSNRTTCDYRFSYTTSGTTLNVRLETFTATRPGERITINPRGTAVVEYPRLATDAGALQFSVVHTTAGFGQALDLNTNISIPYGPGTTTSRINVALSPSPSRVTVAGSRLQTER